MPGMRANLECLRQKAMLDSGIRRAERCLDTSCDTSTNSWFWNKSDSGEGSDTLMREVMLVS